jgi:TolB protein
VNKLLALLPLLAAGVAIAQDSRPNVLINVGQPGERAVPIAVPKPTGGSTAADEYWKVLRRDLEISGWFKVIDPAAFLESPGAGIRPGEFAMQDWRTPGAAVLAKTSLAAAGESLRAEAWVYGVDAGDKLGAKAFTAAPTNVRALAHRTANEIIRLVTGETGFFDTRFACVSAVGGNKEIVIVDADGLGRSAVTKNKSINLKPRWDRSGSKLSFTSYQNGNPDLYVADLGKRAINRISHRSGINIGGAFSPSGDSIALTLSLGGDSEIFTIEPVGGREIARLTSSPGIDASPSWSPDGARIAFVSERGGGPQIYTMNADGSGVKRVSFSGAHNVDPSWSPAGDRIAFVGRDGNFDIFTVRTDGTGMERITQGQGDNEDPSFSPDGRYVGFTSTRSGSPQLWIASADGRMQVQVTQDKGSYTNCNWSGHLSW